MKPITDATLVAEVAAATKPILIKFEASWCQPCKAMTPLILEIEKQYAGRLTVFSANVEHCQLITQRYKIIQIPGLLAIECGVVTAIKTGVMRQQELSKWITMAFPGLQPT